MKREIVYHLPNKSKIKFADDETLYDINEGINIDRLKKGEFAEVEVENDKVVKIEKVEGKKEETKTEEKPEEKKEEPKEEKKEAVITTITVEAIRHDCTAIKIKEGDNKWPKLDSKFHSKEALEKAGIVVNAVLDVKVAEGIIIDVVAIKETPKEEEKKEEKNSYARKNSNRDEESVDKRTASMNAKDLVVALIQKENEPVDKEYVKGLIKELTKTCYEAIQQL